MSTTSRRLHPWELNRREFVLDTWKGTIAFDDEPSTNHLTAATVLYLADGLRCLIVDLNDIGRRHLEVGLRHIEVVLRDGPRPSLGFYPEDFREYWDDEELDYHWARAYGGRYEIELLFHGAGRREDLLKAMDHTERLFHRTNGLGGKIITNRQTILCDYLWAAILANECARALAAAPVRDDSRLTPKSVVGGFKKKSGYLKLHWMLARYRNGEAVFEKSARQSLENLLAFHRDLEHEVENLCCPGPLFGIRWAWLWECLFETQPDVERAVSRLMVFRAGMTGSVRVLAEYNDAGQLRRYYVDGPLYVDEHVLLHEQGADYYYLLGSLYSTAGLMKADGDVIETYGYDAYGAPTAGAPAGLTALGEGPRALRVGVGTAAVNGNGQIAIHVSGNVSECAGGVCTPTPADVACVSRYVQADGTLGDAPVFRTPAEWNGSAGFLRVRGSEIIPDRTYELAADSGMPGMPIRSAPVRAKTMTWGDVQSPPNGDVDLDDVLCVLNGFGSFAACPGADQVPCTGPDGVITLDDILTILSAFGGESYAQACAGVYPPCPSSPVTTMPHNPYYFTGQRLDFNLTTDEGIPLLVLYHYRGRAYGAIDGRFNQRDPAEYVDGFNLYEYVKSNPIVGRDPSGLRDWLDDISDFVAGVGDSLSFGITHHVRSAINWAAFPGGYDDPQVNPSSGYYIAGEATEVVVEIVVTFGGATLRHIAKTM